MKASLKLSVAILALTIPFSACTKSGDSEKTIKQETQQKKEPAAQATPATAATITVAGISFNIPASWKETPVRSQLRKAQYEIGEGDAKADVVFYYFDSSGAGGIEANLDRWEKQFNPRVSASRETAGSEDRKVHYQFVEGTFMSGMPGAAKVAKENSSLVGAIVEGAQGPVFIKLTGPKATVEAATADLKSMAEGK